MIWILLAILTCYALLIFWFCLGVLKKNNIPNRAQVVNGLSVIVPFRNEEENIEALIESLVQQSMPKKEFEVILIDDNSEDDYRDLLPILPSNFRLLFTIGEGKKAAVQHAVQQAKYNTIVQTDADCQFHINWLATIRKQMSNTDMLCGPVIFSNSAIQNLELLSYVGLAEASVKLNIPFVCNGANLAYNKEIYLNLGYGDYSNVSSGDDVHLLYQFHSNGFNVRYANRYSPVVTTKAQTSILQFISQRLRWMGKTGGTQSASLKLISLLTYLANLAFLVGLGMLIFNFNIIVLIGLLIKFSSDFIFLFIIANKWNQLKDLKWYPLTAPFYSLYLTLLAPISLLVKPQWKNRKIQT